MDFNSVEHERVLMDERLRKYMYEHDITSDNYTRHEAELRRLFPGEDAWKAFVQQYLRQDALLSWHDFMKPGQRWDLFPHPRYIQQSDHMHNFFEMKYQLTGNGTVHVDSQDLFLRESDMCVIAPYVSHRNEVYTDDAVMINFVLPAEYLSEVFPRLFSFPNGFRDFLQGGSPNHRWLRIETEKHPGIREIMLEALNRFTEGKHRTAITDLCQEADLEKALLLVLEQHPDFYQKESTESPRDRMMTQMMAYIQGSLSDVSLNDVADLLHFSPTYTSRLIRQQTGFSFQSLLLTMRLDAAALQLKQTELSVDQIATNVGLTGKSNFYEKFRAAYGVTPGEYRSQRHE